MREIPATKEVTVYRGNGRWYQRREAAYYAIAKSMVGARFPRWLDDPQLEDAHRDEIAAAEGIRDWRARRDRMLVLLYDSQECHFHPDKWRRLCRRLAKFLAFVDRRRRVAS
jgi:hypothetical protein